MMVEVWAPNASTLDVVVGDGGRHRLVRDDASGSHRGEVPLGHGDTYWFAIDGSDVLLPDPRSHHQPDGINGPSAIVDHRRFQWTDAGWRGFHLPGSVLYELHVGTFSPEGTFDGAVAKLDHLVELGVDAVEVMPVAEFVGARGWGYDGVSLFAPHHAYGGPEGFKRFVDACHGRGLAVVLDVVYNHLGPIGNYLPRFGPYFHNGHMTPWGQAVNLDGDGADEVRSFLVDNARHWFVDHHVDAIRLDAVHALVDDSPIRFLEQLQVETEALAAHLRRPLWLVAENERNDTRSVLAREAGGYGLPAQWSDDLHHALHAVLTGECDGYYATFGSLRDVAMAIENVHIRRGSRAVGELSGHRFVVFSQNHDQVGNRAIGDRLSHIAGVDAQMAAAAIVLFSPFVPLLFQGEEWAASSPFPYFCDVDQDTEVGAAIREGRRTEFAAFGWDPGEIPDPLAPDTAASAVLRWDERCDGDHARVLAWYRTLLALRRARPDVTDGRRDRTSVVVDESARTLVLRRQRTAVAVNLSDEEQVVHASDGNDVTLLAESRPGVEMVGGTAKLPPRGVAVVETHQGRADPSRSSPS